MEHENLPAVVTAGGTQLQHETPRLARELDSGAIVHLVQIQTGRHRGWFSADQPPGSEPERVNIYWLQKSVGKILDDVRDGAVYEIYNSKEHRVLGYLFWSCPEWLARLETSLQYSFRAWNGRAIYRDIDPTAIQARPLPPRKQARALA